MNTSQKYCTIGRLQLYLAHSLCGAPHAISLFRMPHRVLRPFRTILFGGLGLGLGLGLRVGVLGVVSVWVLVRVSIRVRVGAALVRGYGQGQFLG